MKKFMETRMLIWLFVVLAALWVPHANAEVTSGGAGKGHQEILDELGSMDWDNPDFKVQIKARSRSGEFRIGDTVEFLFKSSRDCYLYVIDVGTSGKVRLIFPNAWQKENRVVADKEYRIPPRDSEFVYRIKGPEGVNYVKAIATTKPIRGLSEMLLGEKEFFMELREPKRMLKDIAVELGATEKKERAEAETHFIIRGERVSEEDRAVTPGSDWERDVDVESGWERDRKNFALRVWTDKQAYRIGEDVKLFVYSERDCYLNLVSFGTSDQVKVIFPNRHQRDNFIRGGKVIQIPGVKSDQVHFKVSGPPGRELIKAVASVNKLQLFPGTFEWDRHVYQPWSEKAGKVSKDIDVQLGGLPQSEFVKAKVTFRVLP